MIIFWIGLIFLVYFSYKDLKHNEIENLSIYLFGLVGIFLVFWTKNYLIFLFCILWFFLSYFLWTKKAIGGADVKILTILPIYYLSFSPNIFSGQFIFLISFGIFGAIYGLFSRQIIKLKEIPFLPLITTNYILNFLFWTI